MAKITVNKINGKKHYFIDGKEVNHYQYMKMYAQNKGYKNFNKLAVDRNYKWYQYKSPEQTFRIKEEHNERPENIQEIPGIPNYYASREGQIWCFSVRRDRWIEISQQVQKTGYSVFQPYIDGKKYVKYCHRAIYSAFNGEIADGYEVHHIDGNNRNNHASNLESIIKPVHRNMKRGPYKPRIK